jgi:hypothetical protein
VVVDTDGSDVVASVVVLVPTGRVDAVNDETASGVDGDDLSTAPSEDESSELHPVAPAIAKALAAATTNVRPRTMLHPATTAPSREITRSRR